MANQYIIRPAPRQNFELFVRYVVGLAEGARVETDTSSRPYFVRVDEGTYRRWVAALPKKPAADALPEPEPEAPPAPEPEPEQQVTQQDAGVDASADADKAPAPAEPDAEGSSEDVDEPAADQKRAAAAVEEAPAAPEPPKPVAKRAKGRTAGASRKRTGGSN